MYKNKLTMFTNTSKPIVLLLFAFSVTACQSVPQQHAEPINEKLTRLQHSSSVDPITQSTDDKKATPPAKLEYDFLTSPCDIAGKELAAAEIPYQDLMQQIRSELKLKAINNRRIKIQRDWYASHPAYLDRTFKRGEPFLYFITSEVRKRNMPMELALLPIVESAFDPFAYSHGRASGIWQFVPWTGKRYGMKLNWWYDGRRDIYASTKGALDYLQRLYNYFDHDWLLALAAYNSGEGNVRKAIKRNQRKHKPTDFWSLKLPKETQAYVPKLLALADLVRQPETYGLHFNAIENKPFLKRVPIGSQIDLGLAADLADLSMEEIYKYNAAFNRWATAPDGPHYLHIPVDRASGFEKKLKKLPSRARIKWIRYKVRTGDSLSTIARKFSTTKKLILSVNQLNNNLIRIGQKLMIPTATRSLSQYSLSADRRLAKITQRKRRGSKIKHRVKAGDNLWDISRKYKVNIRKLAKWNGMATTDKLSVGRSLNVWLTDGNAKAAARISAGPGKTRKIHYRVRNGDSLARISQKFKVAIKDLLKWNRLNPKKYLQPGQSIMLMVDISKQSGI